VGPESSTLLHQVMMLMRLKNDVRELTDMIYIHPDLVEKVIPPGGHGAKVERVFIIDILSYDWNCPKFITPRYTAAEIELAATPLRERIAELETRQKALGQDP
jgi:hypothetical protein